METIERYGDLTEWDLNVLLNEYEEVRRGGMVNMFDYHGVADIASNNYLLELADFIEREGSKGYAWLLKNYRQPER